MAIKVEIPTPLREQAGGNTEVTVGGATVGAALADLVKQYPALEPKLFLQPGQLRPFINVFFRNAGSDAVEDIRYHDDLDTKLESGMIVAVIPAVAGG
jgi:molybdopterin synthase sulfur carrier subunit